MNGTIGVKEDLSRFSSPVGFREGGDVFLCHILRCLKAPRKPYSKANQSD